MIGFRATVSYPEFLLHEGSKHLLSHACARWQEVLLFGRKANPTKLAPQTKHKE